jgi:photosystem II protein
MAAVIQFFRGENEPVVPDIRMTRSRDGRTGQAIFVFEEPVALAPETMGDITGMFMIDEEGELVTREVKARFVNGKPMALEATYTWKTTVDFERFMRFAERYAQTNGLGFSGQGEEGEEADSGNADDATASKGETPAPTVGDDD